MDVTNSNFTETLPEISQAIGECDFIAIDSELSGLMRDRVQDRSDSHDCRFAKAVSTSRGYFIMQFGLSCFKRLGPLHYCNKTYNFYIFPQANEEFGDINRTFSIQAHAIQFLTKHGFDFNKLFREGITYLNFQEKKLVTKKLKHKNKDGATPTIKTNEPALNKDIMTEAKGFLEVIELLILGRKPIIGHNLILDLIHLINQFMEPLTEDYNSFKETCHSLFPTIYDTKFIAHSILDPDTLTNNQTRLNDLYCFLREGKGVPVIKMEHLNRQLVDENRLPHQAGYDAYMSGYCFIVLSERYVRDKRKRLKLKVDEGETRSTLIAQNDHIMKNFANKIFFSYSLEHKCFYLSGDD